MAGLSKQGVFLEKISPYLKGKMEQLKNELGGNSLEYMALYLQYAKQDIENTFKVELNERHWEADLTIGSDNPVLKGFERLYAQSAVIEPTMTCASHCRYCLRANYDTFTLSENELNAIAQYCGSDAVNSNLSELLISGGDTFVVAKRLKYLFAGGYLKLQNSIKL